MEILLVRKGQTIIPETLCTNSQENEIYWNEKDAGKIELRVECMQ